MDVNAFRPVLLHGRGDLQDDVMRNPTDYQIARGYEAGHDKAWHEKWGEGYGDLTDEMIEYIEEKTALCRNCKGYKCSECEV